MAPEFRRTITAMPAPTTAADLQQLLAAANWIRGMIPEFARITEPLQALLQCALQGLPRRNKIYGARVRLADKGWNETHVEAFEQLKAAIDNAVRTHTPTKQRNSAFGRMPVRHRGAQC